MTAHNKTTETEKVYRRVICYTTCEKLCGRVPPVGAGSEQQGSHRQSTSPIHQYIIILYLHILKVRAHVLTTHILLKLCHL